MITNTPNADVSACLYWPFKVLHDKATSGGGHFRRRQTCGVTNDWFFLLLWEQLRIWPPLLLFCLFMCSFDLRVHTPHGHLGDCLSGLLFKSPVQVFAWRGQFIIFSQDGLPLSRPDVLCPHLLLRRGVLHQHLHQRLGTGHWWINYNFHKMQMI